MEEIKLAIKTDITGPVIQLKLVISSKDINQIPQEFFKIKKLSNTLANFFHLTQRITNLKNILFIYDSIANPGKHLAAY